MWDKKIVENFFDKMAVNSSVIIEYSIYELTEKI